MDGGQSYSVSDVAVIAGVIFVVASLVSLLLWLAWRAFNLKGFAFYIAMWLSAGLATACIAYSTVPSSAPRRQAEGIITQITEHKVGKSSVFVVEFLADNGDVLMFDGAATPPFFAVGHDKVKVTYLEEKRDRKYPRAIQYETLTGPRAGFSNTVNANWLGTWIGVPFFWIVSLVAIWIATDNKRSSASRVA